MPHDRGRLVSRKFAVIAALALVAGAAALTMGARPEPVAAQSTLSATFSFNPSPVQAGQPVTIVVAISGTPINPGALNARLPTIGTIAFSIDGDLVPQGNTTYVSRAPGAAVASVTHTFMTPGRHTVSVVVFSPDTQGANFAQSVEVTPAPCGPPTVQVSASPNPVTIGQPVTITYRAQAGPGCMAASAPQITFGDGSAPQTLPNTSGSVTRTYPTAGSFTITFTARSGTPQGSATVTLQVGQPCLTLSAFPQQIAAGGAVTFTYAAQAGAGCPAQPALTLTYGDGSPPEPLGSSSGSVSHVYAAAGTYQATLTAPAAAQAGTATASVVVNPTTANPAGSAPAGSAPAGGGPAPSCAPPAVTLSAAPNPAGVDQPVTFVYTATAGAGCTSQNSPTPSLLITFGDGTAPRSLDGVDGVVPHTFAAPGTYTVTITARAGAQSGEATVRVQVSGGPAPTTTTPTQTTTSPSSSSTPGITVNATAGWNLIGGPAATVLATSAGALYTLGTGDTEYEVVPAGTPLTAGRGYWALFTTDTTYTVPLTGAQTVRVQAPPGRYFMVGNPGNAPATVTGADLVYVYDAVAGMYVTGPTIPVGGGAWVLSNAGGTVTVTSPAR